MRRISWVALLLIGLFVWAGCSGSDADQPAAKPAAGTDEKPAADQSPEQTTAQPAADEPAAEPDSDEPVTGPDLSQPVAPMPEDVDGSGESDPFGAPSEPAATEDASSAGGSSAGGSSVAKSLGRALFRGAQSAGGASEPEQPDEAMPFGF